MFLLRLLRRRMREHWPDLESHANTLFALALVLVSRFLLRDTAGGGGNLVYATLALWGVELALRGSEGAAGLPLALSLVLKPNLVPFLLFLALRRRWRAALSTVLASALLFWLPALHYGFEDYARVSVQWAEDVVAFVRLDELHEKELVPAGMPPAEDGMNQNLREAVFRALLPPGDSGAYDVHVVEVSSETASWVARCLELGLLVATATVALRARGAHAEWLAALSFFPLALLCSPVTWKAHHVVLLPLFHELVCRARTSRAVGVFLFGYWVVCDLFSKEVVGDALRDLLQALSVVTWADIALLGIVLVLARRARDP